MIISQNQAGTTNRRMVIDCWKISVKKLYLRVDQKTVCGRICVWKEVYTHWLHRVLVTHPTPVQVLHYAIQPQERIWSIAWGGYCPKKANLTTMKKLRSCLITRGIPGKWKRLWKTQKWITWARKIHIIKNYVPYRGKNYPREETQTLEETRMSQHPKLAILLREWVEGRK